MKSLIRLLIVAALICAIPAAWLGTFALSPKNSSATAESDAIIEVHRSDTHQAIVRTLVEKGIIDRPGLFNWVGKITRQWGRVKAGEYKFSPAMSPFQIFSTLTSGISIVHPVTVREGENMYEIAADLEAKGLAAKDRVLALCKDQAFIAQLGFDPGMTTLEGFLFPDTYYFNKTMSAQDMVRQMVHHANREWTQADAAAATRLGMTRFQVITLASIIEKETGAPQERPIISSVFHNRLKKKMKLQSDPTTIYGMWSRYQGKIHHSDLLEKTPYNTYTVPGLPEGPISNPGRDSIEAALNPATTDYLFFVSHNDGTHQFSTSLEEHNAAVRKYQLDPKAREGKSWRDLTKKLKEQHQTAD